MTIASEITRLQTAKNNIRTSIINKGVNVPSSATYSDYSGYIDLIDTGSIANACAVGSTIGWFVGTYSGNTNTLFGAGSGYLCRIGDYIFMIGKWGEFYSGSALNASGYIRIYYKRITDTQWNSCQSSSVYMSVSTNVSTSANSSMSALYDSDNNRIVIYLEVTGNWGGSASKYFYWPIGGSSITEGTSTQGSDLSNYKIYESSTKTTMISTNVGIVSYTIDSELS